MPTQSLPPRRDLEPQEQEDSTEDLENALGSVLGVASNVFVDRPGFVASDDEVDPLSAAVRGLTRLNCRRWAAADKSGFSPRVNGYNAGVCGPYLDSIGENPNPGEIGPDFEGGQCPVNYRVSFTATGAGNDCSPIEAGNPDVNAGPGPLSLRYFHDTATSAPVGGLCEGFSYNVVYLRTANGETPLVGFGRGVRLTSFNPFREDGGPDNCGNPVPTYQPPATVTPDEPVPPGIVVSLPGLGDVTVNIDLGPDGNPTFTLPDVGVDFGVEIGGGDDDGDGGTGTEDPGSPGAGGETGGGGESEGEAPEGQELVGLLVTVLEAPERANTFDNNSRAPFRGIGYVRMGYPGRLGVDISGGTVISPQFFHAQQRGLTNWQVAANLGFNLDVTPYYRSAES